MTEKQKEYQREYYKKWRKEHKEYLNEKSKRWNHAHAEQLREYQRRKYHEKHPNAKYRDKSGEKPNVKKYAADNPYNYKNSFAFRWFGKRFKDLTPDERREYTKRMNTKRMTQHCS